MGADHETTVADLAEMVASAAGTKPDIQLNSRHEFEGAGFEDTKRRQPDISLAREVLGWEPKVGLEEGLGITIERWKAAGAGRAR